jgi:hypothetical protein
MCTCVPSQPVVALVEPADDRVREAHAAIVGEERTSPLGIHDVIHVQQVHAGLGPLHRLHATKCDRCKGQV